MQFLGSTLMPICNFLLKLLFFIITQKVLINLTFIELDVKELKKSIFEHLKKIFINNIIHLKNIFHSIIYFYITFKLFMNFKILTIVERKSLENTFRITIRYIFNIFSTYIKVLFKKCIYLDSF